jgi:signal transduction histidine kinase
MLSAPLSDRDFQRLFESAPGLYVVLYPEKNYEIVAVTDSYLRATMTKREEILGRNIFDVFPVNPADLAATEARDTLRVSLETVIRTGRTDVMPVQRYDIRHPEAAGNRLGFVERYWRSVNSAVFSSKGSIRYIIHGAEDVTEAVQLKKQHDDEERASTILQTRADYSEAEVLLRGREIQDLNTKLLVADAAHLELETSQLVRQTEQLREANSSLRELTARLLQVQDDERRRIARELHDSIGQMLAAQAMYLSSVAAEASYLTATAANALKESTDLIDQMSRELRTISYLLHPPLLDEAGLASAIQWFADGFSERSKIRVNLELTPHLGRLSEEFEIALFRIVQECLTNIHRHSGSASATIRLDVLPQGIVLEIRDEGRGISPEAQIKTAAGQSSGVGIRGMRERILQLGGNVEINSSAQGTAIIARLPVANVSFSRPTASEAGA